MIFLLSFFQRQCSDTSAKTCFSGQAAGVICTNLESELFKEIDPPQLLAKTVGGAHFGLLAFGPLGLWAQLGRVSLTKRCKKIELLLV